MTSPRRVLLMLGTSTGGIGQHVRSLAHGLAQRGQHVVVAGPESTEQVFGFCDIGVRFVAAPIQATPDPRDLLVARQLRHWVRGADVVHAHGFRAGLVALAAGSGASWPIAGVRAAGVPLVVTWHNQVLAGGVRGAAMHRVEQAVARGATLNLGASPDLVDQARSCGGRAELGLVAAPRPQPAGRTSAEVRESLGIGSAPMALAVGRLHPQKDYPTMLQAWSLMRGRTPEPVLVIAGDGPDSAAIASLARDLGVHAHLLGRRDDVADLMAAADLLVVSSIWEARALVVQEAMQLGLPVVATAVGGLPGLVGEGAVLVAAGDPRALADAVLAVLDDPLEAHRRADVGRSIAAGWPDEAAVVERVMRAYAAVADSVRRRP